MISGCCSVTKNWCSTGMTGTSVEPLRPYLASNSLLECIVFAKSCAQDINEATLDKIPHAIPKWDDSRVAPSKEKVVIAYPHDNGCISRQCITLSRRSADD